MYVIQHFNLRNADKIQKIPAVKLLDNENPKEKSKIV